MATASVCSSSPENDLTSERAGGTALLQRLPSPVARLTHPRLGFIDNTVIVAEVLLELAVSGAYFLAFFRGVEVLLVLAVLHFASGWVCAAAHFRHRTSLRHSSEPAPPKEPPESRSE
jgi:hypothetical protein